MTADGSALDRADLLLQVGRAEDAVQVLTNHIAANPDDPPALSLLARAHLLAERPQAALDAVDAALGADPEHLLAWQLRSNALCDLGRHQEAVLVARKCVELAPHSWAVHYTLGLTLRKVPGDRAEVLASALKAVELAPDAADPHVLLGLAYHDLGDARTAERCYQRALTIKPDHAYGQSNLSALRLGSGRFAEAMRGFQAAATSMPQETLFHRNIAVTVLGSLLKRGYLVALVTVFVTRIVVAIMSDGSVSGTGISGTAPPLSADWPIRVGLALAILAAWTVLFTIKLRPLTRYLRGHVRRVLFASLRTARAGLPFGGWLLSQVCVLDALLNPTLSSSDENHLAAGAIAALVVGNLLGRMAGRASRPKAN